jgi:hypothetical protein
MENLLFLDWMAEQMKTPITEDAVKARENAVKFMTQQDRERINQLKQEQHDLARKEIEDRVFFHLMREDQQGARLIKKQQLLDDEKEHLRYKMQNRIKDVTDAFFELRKNH